MATKKNKINCCDEVIDITPMPKGIRQEITLGDFLELREKDDGTVLIKRNKRWKPLHEVAAWGLRDFFARVEFNRKKKK